MVNQYLDLLSRPSKNADDFGSYINYLDISVVVGLLPYNAAETHSPFPYDDREYSLSST